MEIKKALVRGTIGVVAGLPLAVQLMTPTAASAMTFFGSQVTAATPNTGPVSGGTTVTITGKGLNLAGTVLFGNVPASYTIVSSTEIIATSPAESAGTVVVKVIDSGRPQPSSADFTYS
jgi:hypothetical protein